MNLCIQDTVNVCFREPFCDKGIDEFGPSSLAGRAPDNLDHLDAYGTDFPQDSGSGSAINAAHEKN